jgi:mRNA-degrading endonuclease toxin of MazEF toxin-antitoxin module
MLLISAEWFNEAENYLVVAVPCTGTHRQIPYQIDLDRREGGLSKNSVVMCDQVRSISTLRLVQKRGEVNQDRLRQVRRMVGRITGAYESE